MSNDLAAREFLREYLAPAFRQMVDLDKITIEKENFVKPDLQKRLSNILSTLLN